ncbi:MAG: AIR synthase-related protein [Myxococcota bacterium]|jgi:phosphoribosylformylglycinamidine synthase|nr:AIR synthase-related protein [Myxococcota bacterium]
MPCRIEVALKRGQRDALGARTAQRIHQDLGYEVLKVRCVDVFTVDAALDVDDLTTLAAAIADPVVCEWSVERPLARGFDWLVEVGFRPGVTDNVGRTSTESARLLLSDRWPTGARIHTSRQYLLSGELVRSEVEAIAIGLLCNPLIQQFRVLDRQTFESDGGFVAQVPTVAQHEVPAVETVSLDLSDDALLVLSKERTWALSLEEMQAIRDHFATPTVVARRAKAGLPAEPTDLEIEVYAQTWSEHCKHKIFNAFIRYYEPGREREDIDSVFKTYVRGATSKVRAALGQQDFCLSVFVDNAGVWKLDDEWNLVFKVETHNSPSALDPYGGALTGIVGVNRDSVATGQGARLFCNTDVFCLASPKHEGDLPPRLLHPRRILEGVREGVEHGGNKSGIPTVNGSLVFDERFLGKPLVFCGTGGIMPKEVAGKPSHAKQAEAGDLIVMVGGRIGKDGIHGATFSSEELHEGSPATAVQIGDPITQKRAVDFLLRARDEGLMSSMTDNGAGGLSSSVGEMAEGPGGARIDLQKAPLKYAGLAPWEIYLSEAQERMTAAVPETSIGRFLDMAREMDVEATVLGHFNNSGELEIRYGDELVGLFDLPFLHGGVPQMKLEARHKVVDESDPSYEAHGDLTSVLSSLLGRLNVCSKEYWVRQYDHEVQGGSVIKPLCGVSNSGPSDAAVVRPVLESMRGVAVGHGLCPRYSDIDAYHMAACAVDEAVRNVVAVGADPDKIAALDNFCWCDPVKSKANPDGDYKLAQLVRANKALYEVCVAYGVPLVSGKDSMKNDYAIGDTRISIPPTLLVTAIGILDDAQLAVTMDAKRAGDAVYVVGVTYPDLGGSEYYAHLGLSGGAVPKLREPAATKQTYRLLHRAMKARLVSSCHDLSDGGLGVALAECAFAGGLGLVVDLREVPSSTELRDDALLFSETPGRFVVTVPQSAARAFEIVLGEMARQVGFVSEDKRLVLSGQSGEAVVDADIFELEAAWKKPLWF